MGYLWDALGHAYQLLGFDSLRVVEEAGFDPPAYATLKRRLPAFAKESWRQKLAAACARTADLGPASLVLHDVSTLYFETDAGDGFREPGFSKERRLEPQITIGLLTDASGFPLMVNAFEGNRGETTTMLPTIRAFMDAHQLADVTVVADAGMISAANQQAIEAAGLSFILGARIPDVPYVVQAWRHEHPDEQIPDGHIFTQPPGLPAPRTSAATRSSTTSTGRTGLGAPCTASTNRSPRPSKPSPARLRSNATGSSSSQVVPNV
nr:IS1634 family transposase [Lentzea flava]